VVVATGASEGQHWEDTAEEVEQRIVVVGGQWPGSTCLNLSSGRRSGRESSDSSSLARQQHRGEVASVSSRSVRVMSESEQRPALALSATIHLNLRSVEGIQIADRTIVELSLGKCGETEYLVPPYKIKA
jgi:hypothetical protein